MATALALAGCKSKPATVPDASLAETIQTTLAADTAIAGQPVQVNVQNGVVTLSGAVANDAQRTLAARDAAAVAGVQKVVNNIGVSASGSVVASLTPLPPPPPPAAPSQPQRQVLQPRTAPPPQERNHPAPIERAYNSGPPPPAANEPPAPQPQPAPAPLPPPPPPAPPAPTFKTVTLAAGATIPVRVTQTLDSGTTQADTTFSGVVASDIIVDGLVAIPAGANVTGHVDAVQDAAHFKGSSLLTVSLTSIARRGERLPVTSDPYTVQGKGRGSNTAEKTGGGAVVGAVLGGIFGGGKGAAIGAGAGAAAGAGTNAVTRGQQVQIASESVVRFHLSAPLSVRVRTDAAPERRNEDGGLQPRSNP